MGIQKKPKPKDVIKPIKLNPKDPLGLSRKHNKLKRQESNDSILNDSKESKPEKQTFRYGNYNQYYGYRNLNNAPDTRINLIDPILIENKRILDIGCNTGQFTMLVASKYNCKYIIGLDIDEKLIKIAKTNMKYYSPLWILGSSFPMSFPSSMGPLGDNSRPINAFFQSGNFLDYPIDSESFDTIFALSISKWIHLNWGDLGLVDFLKKSHNILCSGGCLIIEIQPFSSYKKKCNVHPDVRKNFDEIKLKPESIEKLLKEEAGFARIEKIITFSETQNNRFKRPFYLAFK